MARRIPLSFWTVFSFCLLVLGGPNARAQVAPTIASLSQSQTVTEGQNVPLSVSVNGTTPFSYQWKKNGTAISGATNSTLALNPVRVADEGLYAVVVTNTAGTVTSGDVMIAVRPATAPQFYYQPSNTGFSAGDTLSLSVGVSGTSPLTYDWKLGGTTVATTTSSYYSKTNFQASDAGSYTVTVTNVAGSVTSNAFTVSLVPPTAPTAPSFNYQPQDVTVDYAASFDLYASVSGSSPITFTWKRDGTTVATTSYSDYYKSSVDASDAGSYTVTASNSAGAVTSNAFRVTVRPAVAPTIQSISNSLSVRAGESFSLSVNVTGTPQMSYQWKKDGVAVSGATSSYFYRSPAQASDAGTYTVVVSNAQGAVTSQGVVVSVSAAQPPLITSHPQSQAIALQDYFSMSVGVSGTAPFTYQWKKDGVDIVGATSYYRSSYMTATTPGSYTVMVSNAQGSVISEAAVIALMPARAPTILQQPASQNLVAGASLNLSVSVTAQPSATYQWSKDGVVIPGATYSSYNKSNVASSDAGNYSVVATNSAGTATSANAAIAVSPPSAPRIIQDPASGSLLPGDYFYLSVSASESNATCQWQKNGVAIPGATSSSYAISNAQPSDAGSYTVVVTNSAGSVTSRAGVITIDTVSLRPAITYTSGSALVTSGSWASVGINLSVSSATVRWLKDGVVIPGATSTSFSLQSFGATAAGTYTAEVTTTAGTVTSRPIVLQQLDAGQLPQITRQPVSQAVDLGQYVNFSVSAQGENPLSYQWRKDGTAIPGATSSYYGPQVSNASDAGAYTVVITNRNGTVTSATATLTIPAVTLPVITAQPVSQTVRVGDSIYLNVGLQNSYGVTYQWKKDGTAIAGATNYSYSFYASTSLTGRYTVVVTNSAGSATSTAATIAIASAVTGPSFTAQPVSQTVYVGQPASFSAAATSTAGTVTYQWRKNGTDLSGQTSTTLTWTATQTTDSGTYTVVATDTNGATLSTPATLSVLTGTVPYFTVNPTAATAGVGQTLTLTGMAVGSPAPSYQWRKDGVALTGATTSNLTLSNIQYSDAGTYTLTATNIAGSVTTSGALLTVLAQPPVAPGIIGYSGTNFPLNGTLAIAGQAATIAVIASGYPPPTYQWRKDGVNLPGATSASLTLPNPQASDNGRYSVTVRNALGTVTGSEYVFTVGASATPTIQPATQTVTVGKTVTFAATPGVTNPVTYQWRKNGQFIAGATSSTLTLTNVQLGDAATYTVLVSVVANGVVLTSTDATLFVKLPIYFGSQPQNQTAVIGGTAVFTATVQSVSPATYQWRKNGVPIPGATSATLTLANVQTTDAGAYTLFASNSDGSVESNPAALTIVGSAYAGIYHGTFGPNDNWSLWVRPDGTGVFLGMLTSRGQAILAQNVRVNSDGTFRFGDAGTTAADGASPLAARYYGGSVGGQIAKGVVTGQVAQLGLGFSSVASSLGTSSLAGFYSAVATNGSTAEAYSLGNDTTGFLVVVIDSTGVHGGHAAGGGGGRLTFSDQQGTFAMQLDAASSTLAGTYQPTGGSVVTVMPAAAPNGIERLASLSTRGVAGSDASTMIAGFVITGSDPKEVLIRAVGPALAGFGVPGVLSNPRVRLFKGGTAIMENDDWSLGGFGPQIADTAVRLGAFPLPAGSADAALIARLDPGTYTAHVTTDNAAAGVALIEVYDTTAASGGGTKLISVSTRGSVGRGADALIVGLVVNGQAAKRVLIRGIGPALAAFGVSGTLSDPILRLYNKDGGLVAENDNWFDRPDIASATTQVQAFPLALGSKDAVLLLYLAPGNYTAQVSGVGDTTGVALVEAYEVP
jgi:hypothetical protein